MAAYERSVTGNVFSEVKGSMTSSDGRTVFLRAETIDGDDLMLGFLHEAIEPIIENLAIQAANGRNAESEKMMSAFFATSYDIGKGPQGEPVLVLHMGESAKMNFVLGQDMIGSLVGYLASSMTKN